MLEIQGTPVTVDNLEELLTRCAANLPGDFKPDSMTWGFAAASKFLDDAAGTPLHRLALEVLGNFLVEASEDEVTLAVSLLPPQTTPVDKLRLALDRTDLPDALNGKVAAALARALAWQPQHYAPLFRAQAGKPRWEALVGA